MDGRLNTRRTHLLLSIALASVVLAAIPAAGRAATVRIGAPLDTAPNRAGGCAVGVLDPSFAGPSCTFFSIGELGQWSNQVPRGNWIVERIRIRTGPNPGPMSVIAVRSMRSQAQTDQGPAPAACCFGGPSSQVFVPQPNAVNTVPVRIPVTNGVVDIDGEPVEVVDYLGISLLDRTSSAPVHFAESAADRGVNALTTMWTPRLVTGQDRVDGGTVPNAFPLLNADLTSCPNARAKVAASCDGSGAPILVRGRPRLKGKKALLVPLSCPNGVSDPCRGKVIVKTAKKVRFGGKRRRVKLGAGRFSIDAADKGKAKAKLSKGAGKPRKLARLLKHSKKARKVKVVAKVSDGAGASSKVVEKKVVRV